MHKPGPDSTEPLVRLGDRRWISWPSPGLLLPVLTIFLALWLLTGGR
jgi:hypothetical protein